MKVLHVSGARSWGGNEQQLIYLLEELPRQEVEQVVFCYKDTPVEKEALEQKVKVIAIPKGKPYSAAYRRSFREVLVQEKIDLLHLHTSDSLTGFVVADILKEIKIPVVFAKKGIREKNGWLSRFKYNYRNIDRIICVSDYVKFHFSKILKQENKNKLVTVYDGVKLPRQGASAPYLIREKLNLGEDTFIYGSIANHTKAKDLPTLLRAVEELKRLKPHQNFHVVQIGHYSKLTPELKKIAGDLNVQDHISFLGFVPDASSFLDQFDAVVISSSREGGPSTLMEAFAMKTPVVSTKVGVVEDAIEQGVNGFYVEPGDVVNLAGNMARLMENKELREQFGTLSFEKYKMDFTVEQLAQRTLNIYKELVEI